MLRTILAIVRMAFLDIFAYRSSLMFWAITDAIIPVMMIAVWFVVYQGQSTVAGLTKEQMILYYIGIIIVEATVSTHMEWDVSHDVRQGRLRQYLIKPLSHFLTQLFSTFAWRTYSSFVSVPLAFVIIIALNQLLDLSTQLSFTWPFLVTLVGAFGIFVSMSFCLGYLAFFIERVAGLIHANTMVRTLASGEILPLALFPAWLQGAFYYLPYPYMVDFPIRVLIGNVTQSQFVGGVALQWAWTLGFGVVAALLWHVGLRRYDAPEQVGYGET